MIYYSEEELNDLFQNESFLNQYHLYKNSDEINQLKSFMDNIQINRKYYRLTANNKVSQRKYNRFLSNDTVIIKEINSYLNKLTDKNTEKITGIIRKKIVSKDHLFDIISDAILEKCILHTDYISIYLQLLLDLYPNIKEQIHGKLDAIYRKINEDDIDKSQIEYLQFCDKNKRLDKLIGHSLLITECEKFKIVDNKIHPSLENLLNILDVCTDKEEKYKCIQCLYSIFKSFYRDSLLPEGYIQKLTLLKNKETDMKIKFKIMDIIERK